MHRITDFELVVSILEQNLKIMTDTLECSIRKAKEKIVLSR